MSQSLEVSVTPRVTTDQEVPLLVMLVLNETVDQVLAMALGKVMVSRLEVAYTFKKHFI